MAMTLAVRRRAVCALALLALLCGCCCAPSVWAGTAAKKEVNVPVEVSCAGSDNKLRWRFPGKSEWTQCAAAVGAHDYTLAGEDSAAEDVEVITLDVSQYGAGDDGVGESLCLFAESRYVAAKCNASCGAAKAQEDGQTAFTMNFPTHAGSGVHKKWVAANNPAAGSPSPSAPAATGAALGKPGVCPLTIPAGDPAGKAGGAPKGTAAPPAAGEQPPTSPEAPAAPPAGTAESGARASGERDASPTPPRPSGTPSSAAPSAGGTDVSTAATTTTTTSGPSAAKHAKSHADGSGTIAAVWERAPLLLITTVLACAAA
ncbi:mucin-like glycoprotein [Trypanosoma conorhini]|uniref:Mucin-like glycoprotein n=1 Tax=Trypanosoma conorhini TaxID=83891 RepID=A0A422MZL7_9TRYP|nr:mucin-like glycoprotein [Trypanosoma conorhini]RNE98621.1 mucin-like glycoprotein [Trypanosoma conorhini]